MAAEMEMASEEKKEPQPATLEIGGEDVKVDVPETRAIDLHDRDPHDMNDHVKVKLDKPF